MIRALLGRHGGKATMINLIDCYNIGFEALARIFTDLSFIWMSWQNQDKKPYNSKRITIGWPKQILT
jgi:hypothetical protein